MRTRRVLMTALGAVATATLLAGGALPAAAETGAAATTAGPDLLILTVAPTGPNTTTADHTVTLDCGDTQPAGDHPEAPAACADLANAQGDFAALTPSHVFCPDLYLPVTATAVGVWGGQPIVYQQTFTNGCSLRRVTGHVFAF